MSGNSLDAVDVVVVEFINNNCKIISSSSQSLPQSYKQKVISFSTQTAITTLLEIEHELTEISTQTILSSLEQAKIRPASVIAIGFHGQTLLHTPTENGVSLQAGNSNVIAAKTGIDVISDFRRRDIAASGQGAPLAPLFHQYAFSTPSKNRCIVNIGGIANITLLEASGNITSGFDTGPGNILLDAVMMHYYSKEYDADGALAATGKILPELLQCLLDDTFFHMLPPKSTGRDYFNFSWLQRFITTDYSVVDIMHTITHLTAITITKDLAASSITEIIVCGGGANNKFLLKLISSYAASCKVYSSDHLGISPQLVEAITFAYLAKLNVDQHRVCLANITGSKGDLILGAKYLA